MNDLVEIAKNSGNFSMLGSPTTASTALKATLASRIARALDERTLTVRAAEEATGFAAADFSRIRQGKLDRFTVDRLMTILGALDPQIELSLIVRPKLTREWVIARLKANESKIRAEGAISLRLFGSAARDEAGPESDVDVIVEYDPETKFSLLDIVGVKLLLEEDLGVPVHVTTGNIQRSRLKAELERDAVRVF